MQTHDPRDERIEELEDIVGDYENKITELEEKLKFLEADKDSYYEILVDIHDRLRKAI